MRKAHRRSYDSTGRRKRAEEAQARMLDAAHRLFAERGYAETTIEAIAEAAGVAVPTVYAAFRSKRGLLDALVHGLVSGEPGRPLLETEGARNVAAAANAPELLRRFVEHLSGVQERVIPTYEVMKDAARSDPEIATTLARLQDYRLANVTTIAERLEQLGVLRGSVEEAARTIWVLTSPEVRVLLTRQSAWTRERYVAWLADMLRTSLVQDRRHKR